ncbi:hypothetical protein BDY24DRAFT_395174 [Mrakia frigida]|uniref:uncharacterized protein n=1 Tax=Mrakia frigida TaxID=29902 RepID=UPI003FCBF425
MPASNQSSHTSPPSHCIPFPVAFLSLGGSKSSRTLDSPKDEELDGEGSSPKVKWSWILGIGGGRWSWGEGRKWREGFGRGGRLREVVVEGGLLVKVEVVGRRGFGQFSKPNLQPLRRAQLLRSPAPAHRRRRYLRGLPTKVKVRSVDSRLGWWREGGGCFQNQRRGGW